VAATDALVCRRVSKSPVRTENEAMLNITELLKALEELEREDAWTVNERRKANDALAKLLEEKKKQNK
jgi:hypothetical protein